MIDRRTFIQSAAGLLLPATALLAPSSSLARPPRGGVSSGTLSGLAISIDGTNFISGAMGSGAQSIQLRGVNASGYEHTPGEVSHTAGGNPMADFGNWAPGYPPFNYLLADWGFGSMPSGTAPVLRLPVNEQAWLGLDVIDGSGAYYSADPASAYQGYIDTVVELCESNGIYVILDLHWTMPGPLASLAQNQFVDNDHSTAFWTSVANYAKTKPWVMLELFNEPIIYTWADLMSTGLTESQTAYSAPGYTSTVQCFTLSGVSGSFVPNATGTLGTTLTQDVITSNGGQTATVVFWEPGPGRLWVQSLSAAFTNGQTITGSHSGATATIANAAYGWQTSNYQACLNAVRTAGFNGPVLVGSLNYSGDLDSQVDATSSWIGSHVTDPLGTPQIAAVWHAYSQDGASSAADWGSQNYAIPTYSSSSAPSSYAGAAAVLAGGYPVIITETGDRDAAGTTNTWVPTRAPNVQEVTQWADQQGVSCLLWGYNPWGDADNVLVPNGNDGAAATPGYGYFGQNWLNHQPRGAGNPLIVRQQTFSGSITGCPVPVPTPSVSSGTASYLTSGDYNNAWRTTGAMPQYCALDVSWRQAAGVKQVEVVWYCDLQPDFDEYARSSSNTYYNNPGTYEIQTNTAAGGTYPSSGWTTVATIGNRYSGPSLMTLSSFASLVSLSGGVNWIRLYFTASNGSSGNSDISICADLYDATSGLIDGHLLIGDSLMSHSMAHTNPNWTGTTVDCLDFGTLCNTGGFPIAGTISAGGSGYVNGTYDEVPLTGGSGVNLYATVTVSGGAVTAVALEGGYGYLASDTGISASNANLGGSGSGFTYALSSVQGPQRYLGYSPPAQNGGQSSWAAQDWATYFTGTVYGTSGVTAHYPNLFADYPGKYVWICLGTNADQSVSVFEASVQVLITAAQAAGKTVILEKIQPSPGESQIPSYNTAITSVLYPNNPTVIEGIDWSNTSLYNFIYSGPHPDSAGAAIQRIARAQFACALS